MDNIKSYINVKFYYLLNDTTPGSVAINRFGVISKNIFKNLKKLGKYSYFFYIGTDFNYIT